MDTIYAIIGSAFGGFLGVIAFFLVRYRIEINKTRKKFIIEYSCASELNQGQSTESEGELMHHHGRRISDPEELKLFDVDHPIWEWTNNPVGKGEGTSIIYGPYTTDFEEPGMYLITFVMRSIGLTRPIRKIDDHILIELDINSSVPDYAMKPTGDFVNFDVQNKSSRGYVRINNLAEQGWVDCDLRFYSDAKGLWEYRILPYHGREDPLSFLKIANPNARIVFDKIVVHKIPKFQMPTV